MSPPGTVMCTRGARHVAGGLAASALYFVLSLAIAMVVRGTDLDRLAGRSALSRAAARVHDVLWAPHDWIGRTLEPAGLPGGTPALLAVNALARGRGCFWRNRSDPRFSAEAAQAT